MVKFKQVLNKASLGLVLVLFWAWMFIRAEQFFPVNTDKFRLIMQTYILFATLVFGFNALASERTERILFRTSFLKELPKFIIAALISGFVFLLFNFTLQGKALPSIYDKLEIVGIGVLLIHALFVATLEEKIFRGWLYNELRARGFSIKSVWFLVALVFAFFHSAVGGKLITIVIYIPLSYLFMWVKIKFSPVTDMANSGVHFAWNAFVIGFLSGI